MPWFKVYSNIHLLLPGNSRKCVCTNTRTTYKNIYIYKQIGKKIEHTYFHFFLLYAANKGQLPESSVTKVIYGIFGILRLIAGEFSYFFIYNKNK